MLPVEIKKDIFWVGAVDFASQDFHGYSISPQGTTYNSYLVKDEKTVLFDTVKREFMEEMIRNIKKVINPEKIDYFVINHVELDHSGILKELVELCKPEKIFCSPMGKKSMEGHFDISGWPVEVKKTGDIVNIGKRHIHFIETRMVHWPDSMFSYIPEEGLLITNDGFGQNIASTERFADEFSPHLLEYTMSEYYHNIILPYSQRVISVLDQMEKSGLKIDMIAPDHGLIFRGEKYVKLALDRYRDYALQKTKEKALIIYDTMWHSTQLMADAIAEGICEEGIPVRIMFLKQHHHSTVMTELAHCGLLVAGSPTHNNSVLPNIAGMLTYMKGLKPKNRIGGAFCSYGWSGESADYIQQQLKETGFEMPEDPLKVQFVPNADALENCYNMGRNLAQALQSKINR